jgi:CheY-like chemotaxis protein
MEPHGRAAIECLLAEDDPAEVRLVRDALPAVPLPIHLNVVDDGDQALAFLRQHGVYVGAPRPDLVILDVNLPTGGGDGVLAGLTGDSALQAIPVFVALEFAGERVRVQQQGLQRAHYLLKPLTARQLLCAFGHRSMRDRANETIEAAQAAITRAHVLIDWARKVQQESQEFRQYRRAWAERKAEQHSRPRSDFPPLPISSRAQESPVPSPLAVVDFLVMAEFMREELQKFFSVARKGQDHDAIVLATEQLQHALSRCEPLVSNPEQRNSLPLEQCWGFLLLLSSVQSAREALKRV